MAGEPRKCWPEQRIESQEWLLRKQSPSETLKPVVWSTLDFASVSGPESQHVDGAGPRLLPLAPSKVLTVTVLARSLERNAECYEPRTVIVFGPEEVALH